ncbi:ABC transporter permease [Helcobacillus sp. ACRRO]|uniref:ABC transporter permease n=1 Tax=Helcobacillus TaxID=1161125 RepID=UPI001EF50779|nr:MULTISPECIES: ABC transporter permease [Helcobacillus]MCG7426866.1 ABC transporter permease [Helcobacillus sp. ACRRO]MDK7742241.1 ABC transporter permease [Helcobacillus massiliensis]WOO93494.1 ABC transporter permease [Helcobacillus massiliensis]
MSRTALNREEKKQGWREPGDDAGWLNPVKERFLLRLLVKKELRVRYRGSVLGMAWSYVKPAAQFLVFFIALGVFLQLNRSMPAYAVYLFSGIVVINLFGEVFGNCTRSISSNAPLVSKIYLPSELFPWSSAVVAIIHFIPQLLVLTVGALVFGWRPGLTEAASFAAGFAILVIFTVGLGMLAAALNAAFRDVENFVDLIIMIATWASPILYPISLVHKEMGDSILWSLYAHNPLTIVVELFHSAFWRGYARTAHPSPEAQAAIDIGSSVAGLWWFGLLTAIATFIVGALVFDRAKRSFAQEL